MIRSSFLAWCLFWHGLRSGSACEVMQVPYILVLSELKMLQGQNDIACNIKPVNCNAHCYSNQLVVQEHCVLAGAFDNFNALLIRLSTSAFSIHIAVSLLEDWLSYIVFIPFYGHMDQLLLPVPSKCQLTCGPLPCGACCIEKHAQEVQVCACTCPILCVQRYSYPVLIGNTNVAGLIAVRTWHHKQ